MSQAAAALGRLTNHAWPLAGLALGTFAWAIGAQALSDVGAIAAAFSPLAAARAAARLLATGEWWPHVGASLRRIGWSLVAALAIGVPLGLALGQSAHFARAAAPLVQLLRMISRLSWMPIAVMALGVGDAPVVFLLAFAALWPVALSTAAGVAALEPSWLRLAESLAATRIERLCHVVLPGIVEHLLTGFRLALGVAWIVLVPAEMLGVSSGLGYFILDTRDRLAYDELTATIVLIGLIGWSLDAGSRAAHRAWTHAPD